MLETFYINPIYLVRSIQCSVVLMSPVYFSHFSQSRIASHNFGDGGDKEQLFFITFLGGAAYVGLRIKRI